MHSYISIWKVRILYEKRKRTDAQAPIWHPLLYEVACHENVAVGQEPDLVIDGFGSGLCDSLLRRALHAFHYFGQTSDKREFQRNCAGHHRLAMCNTLFQSDEGPYRSGKMAGRVPQCQSFSLGAGKGQTTKRLFFELRPGISETPRACNSDFGKSSEWQPGTFCHPLLRYGSQCTVLRVVRLGDFNA